MKVNEMPEIEILMECFEYNESTGALTWKDRPISHFKNERAMRTVNAKFSGIEAGSKSTHIYTGKTYRIVSISGKRYPAHRICALFCGLTVTTDLEVDHIDGNGLNNRKSNLRMVNRTVNSQNHRLQSNNTSGVVGVAMHSQSGLWRAYIKNDGKTISLGTHSDFNSAVAARKSAEVKFGYHKNHGEERPL